MVVLYEVWISKGSDTKDERVVCAGIFTSAATPTSTCCTNIMKIHKLYGYGHLTGVQMQNVYGPGSKVVEYRSQYSLPMDPRLFYRSLSTKSR